MDFLIDENNKLKKIIRLLDKRVEYLEKRIISIIDIDNQNDIYYCDVCNSLCGFDEEKCDYNIFCNNHICIECIKNLKNDINDKSMCKNVNCKKWYCYNCLSDNDFLIKCYNCDNSMCELHYNQFNCPIDICYECNNDSIMINKNDYEKC